VRAALLLAGALQGGAALDKGQGDPGGLMSPAMRHLLVGEIRLTKETGHSDVTEGIYINTESHNLSSGDITDRI
jgi:hypothetical protein